MKDTKKILREIKRILKKRGWTKGRLYDKETGRCCLLGAWALAEGYNPQELTKPHLIYKRKYK